MKKIAIIGGSNSFIKNGYGAKLKDKYGDQCDIYSLGATGLGWIVYSLAAHKIIDKYEFVIMQFGPQDSSFLYRDFESLHCPLGYLNFILNAFCGSQSTPIFICASYTREIGDDQFQYLIQAVAEKYSIQLINLQSDLLYIDNKNITFDGAHYSGFIVEHILNSISFKKNCLPKSSQSGIDINFEVYFPDPKNNYEEIEFGSSLLHGKVFKIDNDKKIFIPDNKYICGFLFWNKEKWTNLYYQNSYIKLVKYLYGGGYTDLYVFHDLGVHTISGLKGGEIGCQVLQDDIYFADVTPPNRGTGKPLYIHSLLLSDRPLLLAGYSFFVKHEKIFMEAMAKSASILAERTEKAPLPLGKSIDGLLAGGWTLIKEALQRRPDLAVYLRNNEFRAERLLLWAWKYGRMEIPILKDASSGILSGLKKMSMIPYKNYFDEGYSLLHHAIWLERPDLHNFDPETPEGRKALVRWFENNGKREYGLLEL